MANSPTIGIFLPGGYLDNFNSASDTGQVDAYGNIYPSGSNVGKMIEVGDAEASNLTSPGTAPGTYANPSGNPLFGGAYQIVQVDSGATAANIGFGLAAFIKLDSGVTQGALPETSYANIVVTDESGGGVTVTPALYAGVFLNAVTPGNFGIIWVGAGRATVKYAANLTNSPVAVGDYIEVGGHAANAANGYGTFNDRAASSGSNSPSSLFMGIAVSPAAAGAYGAIYARDIFYRIPN